MTELSDRELRRLVLQQAVSKQGASFLLKCGAMCDHTPKDTVPDLYTCRNCGLMSNFRSWIHSLYHCNKE